MALDELRKDDKSYDIDGFTYLINNDFLEKVQPIKVDFTAMGFSLTCGVDFSQQGSGSCSGCGTSSNCCSTK